MDVQVQRFWRAFRSLENDDRAQFIRFAWGRARLPRLENWHAPFKLTRHHGGDSALPIGHTWYVLAVSAMMLMSAL